MPWSCIAVGDMDAFTPRAVAKAVNNAVGCTNCMFIATLAPQAITNLISVSITVLNASRDAFTHPLAREVPISLALIRIDDHRDYRCR